MIKSRYILFFSLTAVIALSLFFRDVPFFWDGTFFSETAIAFYEGRFSAFDCPEGLDNVTFPVFSAYLAFVWKLFSKSLLVSHMAMLPFLLGICYEFYKLAGRFLNERFVAFAMILLLLEPAIMTQGIIMGYDIILVYLFLLSLNLLLKDRKKMYSVVVTLIALYSIRGLFLALSLSAVCFFLQYPKMKFKGFLPALKVHLLCILVLAAWFIHHKLKTGWLIISPLHENTDEQLLPFSMMLRQVFFITWKAADNGRIILWIIIAGGTFIFMKNKMMNEGFNTLLKFLFIPLIISAVVMIPFSNPVGHRYFMFSFPVLIIAACYVVQFALPKSQTLVMIILPLCLLSGNFWLYPERFGNGWDTSLKTIPYFKMKEKMDEFILQSGISPEKVGTQYPLIADKRFSHLQEKSFAYTNVWRGPLSNFEYYLQSNVINTDISEQTEEVKKNWPLVKKIESGQVYISLYKNPTVEE
jgi:hypothetical protein